MLPAGEALVYLPVVVWAATGLGLVAAYRRSAPPVVLRLAAAFLALWALVATATLLWVIGHGGEVAAAALVADPGVLFAAGALALWAWAGVVVLGLLSAAFLVNQAVGFGMLRLLRPEPMPWPHGLGPGTTPTYLGRYRSPRPEAFSFTVLERHRPNGSGWGRLEVILVSESLLDRLDPAEQRAVVAHELGHVEALDSRYLTFLRTSARLLRWDPFFAVLARSLTHREELRADRIAV